MYNITVHDDFNEGDEIVLQNGNSVSAGFIRVVQHVKSATFTNVPIATDWHVTIRRADSPIRREIKAVEEAMHAEGPMPSPFRNNPVAEDTQMEWINKEKKEKK
jgi:hypothetical protein